MILLFHYYKMYLLINSQKEEFEGTKEVIKIRIEEEQTTQ